MTRCDTSRSLTCHIPIYDSPSVVEYHGPVNSTKLLISRSGNRYHTITATLFHILGDPGATSRDDGIFRRESLLSELTSPWDCTLNRPVPKPNKILVCDWVQKNFCAQSESSPFRVAFVTSYSKVFTYKLFDRLFAILVRLVQESFPRSRSVTERRTIKPKKSPNLACL